jgi:protoheme ferro-lyase
MSRKGILLLNLGSPKSTAVPDVRNYLREFLNDDRVIDYPAPLRWLLLEGIILRTRPKKSAAALTKRPVLRESGWLMMSMSCTISTRRPHHAAR